MKYVISMCLCTDPITVIIKVAECLMFIYFSDITNDILYNSGIKQISCRPIYIFNAM